MNHVDFIGTLVCGSAILLLPMTLPLFFCSNVQRRVLFYFVGLACCFLCYKVAIFLWAFFAVLLGHLLASLRHEDFNKSIEYGFALVAPGIKEGHILIGLLPMLTLGTLLSVVVLKKLKTALFKPQESAGVN
jgi:predicted permease